MTQDSLYLAGRAPITQSAIVTCKGDVHIPTYHTTDETLGQEAQEEIWRATNFKCLLNVVLLGRTLPKTLPLQIGRETRSKTVCTSCCSNRSVLAYRTNCGPLASYRGEGGGEEKGGLYE